MELVKKAFVEKNEHTGCRQFGIKFRDSGEEILIILTLWHRNNYFLIVCIVICLRLQRSTIDFQSARHLLNFVVVTLHIKGIPRE
jgi:hypothetical protein